MALVTPDTGLAARICKALGIERAKSVAINMQANDVMTVDVKYMPTTEQVEGVAKELESRRYVLHEAEGNDA